MREHRLVVWPHHGIFGAGSTMDETFGLIETAEKAAEEQISDSNQKSKISEFFSFLDLLFLMLKLFLEFFFDFSFVLFLSFLFIVLLLVILLYSFILFLILKLL